MLTTTTTCPSPGETERTIGISTVVEEERAQRTIAATDSELSRTESDGLSENGAKAARAFLERWNCDEWKTEYWGYDLMSV
jgi:hypothetical protein